MPINGEISPPIETPRDSLILSEVKRVHSENKPDIFGATKEVVSPSQIKAEEVGL